MINVYEQEIKDGIYDLVSNASISYSSAIKTTEGVFNKKDILSKLNIAKASKDFSQIDLLYKHSILASVGWNLNDDVFTKKDTWQARNSVNDKRLNLEHNELDIVGHMTNSFIIGDDGTIINSEESLPDRFDVVSEFVLYKIWEGQERNEQISNIIKEIEENKWFVSMECRFSRFDYGLIDSKGNHRFIHRTEATAFLSKHLRVYGGSGKYQGNKIGRVLRDFIFTGQGLVRNPGNTRSIIFDIKDVKFFNSNAKVLIMEDELKQVTEKYEVVKAELESIKAEMNKEKEEDVKKSKAELLAVQTELASVKAELSKKDEAIASLTSELALTKEQIVVARAEASAMKEDMKKKDRMSKLANVGVAAEELDSTLAKWSSLNDEQFDLIVAMYPKKEKAEEKTVKTQASVDEAVLEKSVASVVIPETKSRSSELASFLASTLKYSSVAQKRISSN